MVWLAGVDGCRRGWFRVCRESESGELTFDVLESPADLWLRAPHPRIVAVDMPIGLSASGPRECDRAARALLGPRRSSVFPAPIRASIVARTREEASRITQAIDGRKVAAQAWGLYPKIRALDEALRAASDSRSPSGVGASVREVHPELSFWAWNDRVAMTFPKRRAEGARERRALVAAWLGDGVLAAARGEHPRKDLADDDILDAIATLWTAHRIEAGCAESLPGDVLRDAAGMPMEIVF